MALKDPGSIIQYRGPFLKDQSLEIGHAKHCRIGISMSQDDFMEKSGHWENGVFKQDDIIFYINNKKILMGRTHIYQYLDHPLENFTLSFGQNMPASTTVDVIYCEKQQES